MIKQGTYKPLIQGVSQQTPQDRSDGQLGEQVNMLSDIVTGLRRRSGTKFLGELSGTSSTDFIHNIYLYGVNYLVCIDIKLGVLRLFDTNATLLYTSSAYDYLKASDGASLRVTVARDNLFIVNTSLIPTPVYSTSGTNPNTKGYFGIVGTALSKTFRISITVSGTVKTVTYTTASDTANGSYPTNVVAGLVKAIDNDSDLPNWLTYEIRENVVGLTAKTGYTIDSVETDSSENYVLTSQRGYLLNKNYLISKLPPTMDGYIIGIGSDGNRSYYKYDYTSNMWSECGSYSGSTFTVKNEPMYLYYETDKFTMKSLGIKGRSAGDDDNNPLPKFINFGITGISAYQSRLVLLSGGYVNFSQSAEFNQFMRTTVTEVLNDDPIEVSSASLSSTQFEYAIPYNKDLVLIAQDQQAVIPSNSTVLTPKTAVIYPSSYTDVSLRTSPTVVARSVYYVYQRGSDYFQVGELIPNSYTDAQYYSQGLTDHIPLYATNVCTHIAGSTTNNLVVFCSDSKELLVHQFLWSGDTRPQMAFHKWSLPYECPYAFMISDQILLVIVKDGKLCLLVNDIKINQLSNKPQPYLDLYSYVTIKDGVGTLPDHLVGLDVVAVIYDNLDMRHKEVTLNVDGTSLTCPYDGVIVVGVRYTSTYILTPPLLKDENGTIVAGVESQLKELSITHKNSGDYNILVTDQYGTANAQSTTAMIWSQAKLQHTWIGSQLKQQVDCRTDLSSTQAEFNTQSTTELNPISTSYVLKVARKHR